MDEEFKNYCMRIFDFSDNENLLEKSDKSRKLEIILELFRSDIDVRDELKIFYPDIIDIIKINLFRELSPTKLQAESINFGSEFDKCVSIDEIDEHRPIVYRILNDSILFFQNDHKYLNSIFTDDFIKNLFNLIHSDSEFERQNVSKVCQTIYQEIPACRNIIEQITNEKLLDILSEPNEINVHLECLLYLYKSIIEFKFFKENNSGNHHENNKRPFEMNTIKTSLLALHRLKYLYHFYQPLFMCTMIFMCKYPEKIIDIMKKLINMRSLSSISTSSVNSKQLHTSISLLTITELKMVFNLILTKKFPNNNDKELLLSQLIPIILPLLMKNLKSLNMEIIQSTIYLLSFFKYEKYFQKYMTIKQCEQLIEILNDEQYKIYWDHLTLVQQNLYLTNLKQRLLIMRKNINNKKRDLDDNYDNHGR